jgi:hypothetical protein|nr:MAG TPA: hypothetical protein [Caudoviricetes sp.]DAT25533.1 MAG TPA: hypothetical protein [Caudoviricetes sp.]
MTNYEKLQAEAQKTKELVTRAVIVIPEDELELSDMKAVKELAKAVDEQVKITESRTDDRKEESARITVQYVKRYNSRLLEIIEDYN